MPAPAAKVEVPAGGQAMSPFARQVSPPGADVSFGSTRGKPVDLRARIAAARERGRPLPATEREIFEPRLGSDLSRVRLHTGTPAAKLAQDFEVPALTVGQDVFFGSQAYQPGTGLGRRILVHELAHAAQQAEAPAGAAPEIGDPVDRFENEARKVESVLAGASATAAAPVRLKTPLPRVQAFSPAQAMGVKIVDNVEYDYNNDRPDSIAAPITLGIKGGRKQNDQTSISRLFNAFTNNDSFFGQTVEFAAGHLIGDQFGAEGNVKNLVAMEDGFNGGGGAYGRFENKHVKGYLTDRSAFLADVAVKSLLGAYWNFEIGGGVPLGAPDPAYMGIQVHYGANRHKALLSAGARNIIHAADPNLTATVQVMADQIPDQLTCNLFGDPFADFFEYLEDLKVNEFEQHRVATHLGFPLYKGNLNVLVDATRQAANAVGGDVTVQQMANYLAGRIVPPASPDYAIIRDGMAQLILARVAPPPAPAFAMFPGLPAPPPPAPTLLTVVPQADAIDLLKALPAQAIANRFGQAVQQTNQFKALQEKADRAGKLLDGINAVPQKLQNEDALGGEQAANFQLNPLGIDNLFRGFLKGGSTVAPNPRYGI